MLSNAGVHGNGEGKTPSGPIKSVTLMITEFTSTYIPGRHMERPSISVIIDKLNDILLTKNLGVKIKSVGTKTYYTFNDSSNALHTAFNIKGIVDKYNLLTQSNTPVLFKIAIHTGPMENDDLKPVTSTASLLISKTDSDCIYLTEEAYNALPEKDKENCKEEKTIQSMSRGVLKIYKVGFIADILKTQEKPPEHVKPQEQEKRPDMILYGKPVGAFSKKLTTVEAIKEKTSKDGFPVMSHTIDLLLKLPENLKVDEISVTQLTNVILDDFSLTNKLLSLVNTAYYTQYDGKINTMSRAIMLLGFVQIRSTALSLLLFEDIADKHLAYELKILIINSIMSSMISKNIALNGTQINAEEAFICSMLHDLGKILVAYFLPEDYGLVTEKIKKQQYSEDMASRSVLGMSYEELGISISTEWKLPKQAIHCMHKLDNERVIKPETNDDRLRGAVAFSAELCSLMLDDSIAITDKQMSLKKITKRYGECFTLSQDQMSAIFNSTLKEMNHYFGVYDIKSEEIELFRKISDFYAAFEAVRPIEVKTAVPVPEENKLGDTEFLGGTLPAGNEKQESVVFQRAIYDITTALLEDYSLNDTLRMILEIIYNTMGFSHVLICRKNSKQDRMVGWFGFGADIDVIVSKFNFPIVDSDDVFSFALKNGSDMVVADSKAPDVKERIPLWYANVLNSDTFVVLPIIVSDKPIAVIYADNAGTERKSFSQHQIWCLKALRKQVNMVFKQKLKT
ncbi:MAG: HDOD domain-containing protein [Nitrospirae bacterium]|nr:HDOD domain-containing protein [Nitrospirota bacterium]MBF0534666.1 HDOD domain-containing protein [Nitrospirota bacterium]MBF0616290.1 HDOD domain-containing protein [Nitrospirota bacterium]